MTRCVAPLDLDTLSGYWAGEISEQDSAGVEDHVFVCADCAERLEELAATAHGLRTLARQGRITGIIPYDLLNRLSRDGVRVRFYWLAPGESVPCAAWPEDETFVVGLRVDLTAVKSVTLVVTGPNGIEIGRAMDVPVAPGSHEVLHATAGTIVQQIPSMRIQFTLTDAGPGHRLLCEYILQHSSTSG